MADEATAMEDERDLNDAVAVGANGVVAARTTWVHVFDGVVKRIAHTYDGLRHPFSDLDVTHIGHAGDDSVEVPLVGDAVLRGKNDKVSPGMLVDRKGNFTQPEGRIGPLSMDEPATIAGPALTGNGDLAEAEGEREVDAGETKPSEANLAETGGQPKPE